MARKAIKTFEDVAPHYLAQRQVSPRYARHVTAIAGRAGKLEVKSLNGYLLKRIDTVSGITVRHERTICLSLWRWAYDQGLYGTAPRGVMRMRAKKKPTKAWTIEQIKAVVAACETQRGRRLRSGADKGLFLRTWVLLAYESGARMGDVFAFRKEHLDGETLAWTQSKTGDPLTRTLSPACVEAAQELLTGSPDGSILGWVCGERQALQHMRALLRSCGLDGTSKWLRRSGATHCEMQQAGAGRLHLGHRSPALFEAAYCDWSQLRTRTPKTPAIV
jgi:integrase